MKHDARRLSYWRASYFVRYLLARAAKSWNSQDKASLESKIDAIKNTNSHNFRSFPDSQMPVTHEKSFISQNQFGRLRSLVELRFFWVSATSRSYSRRR